MPNPSEEIYMCLKTLLTILNEIDEPLRCPDFLEVQPIWIPEYIKEYEGYI
jgi:hypothetical protein